MTTTERAHTPRSPEAPQACPRCIERGQTWSGDAPSCAFATGTFVTANWNCATANGLREILWQAYLAPNAPTPGQIHVAGAEDQWLGTWLREGVAIVASWYKQRGRTEGLWYLDGADLSPLTLERAERWLGGGPVHPGSLDGWDGTTEWDPALCERCDGALGVEPVAWLGSLRLHARCYQIARDALRAADNEAQEGGA